MKTAPFIVLVILVAGVITYALVNNDLALPKEWETRIDDQPPVTVTATPLELEAAGWKFHIGFDTHSIELVEDPMQVITLTDGANTFLPIRWEGPGPGGHHREGVIVFNAFNPIPSYFELKIKDVGGISERFFRWNVK